MSRTYRVHKNLYIYTIFTNYIWSYELWSPVIALDRVHVLILFLVLMLSLCFSSPVSYLNRFALTFIVFILFISEISIFSSKTFFFFSFYRQPWAVNLEIQRKFKGNLKEI